MGMPRSLAWMVLSRILLGVGFGSAVVLLFAGIIRLTEGYVEGIPIAMFIGVTVGGLVGLLWGILIFTLQSREGKRKDQSGADTSSSPERH